MPPHLPPGCKPKGSWVRILSSSRFDPWLCSFGQTSLTVSWVAERRSDDSAALPVTDARADKVAEVAGNPRGELVWWFPKRMEQYRIAGQLELVGADHPDADLRLARLDQWGNWTDRSRETMWSPPPGAPHDLAPAVVPPSGGRDRTGQVLPPPDNFLLLLLRPSRTDYLRLTDNFRQVYTAAGDVQRPAGWTSTRVNP
eukprot:GGOE01006167.1.p1 GENE.GGOE01006167.1~~GGOE01006167.1.p1  ORF type:complete len:199 (+),score=17.45 GGOE01006167.1:412-1008(+)